MSPNHNSTVGSHCKCDECHKRFSIYMRNYRATHRAYRNYQKKLKREARIQKKRWKQIQLRSYNMEGKEIIPPA